MCILIEKPIDEYSQVECLPVARTTQVQPGASRGSGFSAVDSAHPRQQGRGSSGSSTQKAANSERQAR